MTQKVNCNVMNVADGSKHLVFTIEGTQRCVGEIRVSADDNYLLVISQLFSSWVTQQRGRLPSSIRSILNGKRSA